MRLIDADALRDELFVDYFDSDDWGFISSHIDNAPTVDAVERKRGRWREYPIADGINQCSECGGLRFGESNFCPNCGAEMRKGEEE